jgi:hypothetical protein
VATKLPPTDPRSALSWRLRPLGQATAMHGSHGARLRLHASCDASHGRILAACCPRAAAVPAAPWYRQVWAPAGFAAWANLWRGTECVHREHVGIEQESKGSPCSVAQGGATMGAWVRRADPGRFARGQATSAGQRRHAQPTRLQWWFGLLVACTSTPSCARIVAPGTMVHRGAYSTAAVLGP